MEVDKKLPEVNKGAAVQQQLRIWDALLEVRIRLQKILVETNKLPQKKEYWSIYEDPESITKLNPPTTIGSVKANVSKLLSNLLQLKNEIMETNSETRGLMSGKSEKLKHHETEILSSEERELDEEELGSEEDSQHSEELDKSDEVESDEDVSENVIQKIGSRKRRLKDEEYEVEVKKRHESFRPYRNQVIQKWNDRTQVASGKMNKRSFSAFQVSTLKQIEQILSDKERLVRRTQLKRTQYLPLGKDKNLVQNSVGEEETLENYDQEIFDDDDFYHQMLRELIERKTSNVNDPIELSRHWLELQKLRSKTKKKVDTKASKARKIRYEIYPKLVNLMAPADQNPMTDHAVNEIFASIFGSTKI